MLVKVLAAPLLVLILVAAAACGGGDEPVPVADDGAGGPAVSPTSAPNPTSVPSSDPTPQPSTSVSTEPSVEFGTLRMLVSDQENAIGDFAQLIVTIERVSISRTDGAGGLIDLDVALEDQEVDLVQLQGDAAEEIVRADVAVGRYSKIFLRITEVRGVLNDDDLTEVEVTVPGGSLQLNKPFEVTADSVTEFVYDITVVSAGPASGDVKYLIRPVI